MRKEGFTRLYNSRDARVNIMLFAAILVIFALTMVFVEALTIQLVTPGNSTFNATTSRNLNFTFNATWFSGATALTAPHENVSNCSLYMNLNRSNLGQGNAWEIVKNVSNGTASGTGTDNLTDNKIQNGSGITPSLDLSYMNFTFPRDGNFTFAIACYTFRNTTQAATLNFSGNFTVFVDATPPAFNFSELNVSIYNTTVVAQRIIEFKLNDSGFGVNLSYNGSINMSIFLGGRKVAFFNYTNSSAATNLTCSAIDPPITTAIITCNASYNFNSNGSYTINISAQDAIGSYNQSTVQIVVDQIPPQINGSNRFNLSNGSQQDTSGTLGGTTPATVPTAGDGTWTQGRRLFAFANVTDNLTRPVHAYLQFYNVTSAAWKTVNSTVDAGANITPSATDNVGIVNISYNITKGHNVFEGANVSFRLLINDTMGNVNSSGEVINITVQINDTTKPDLLIQDLSGISAANFSNTTNTTPTIRWNITDNNNLNYIAIQFDSLIEANCGFKNFTSVATANANRNGTLNAFTSAGCPTLNNGTHTVKLSAQDSWGNGDEYIHSFTITTAEAGPNITLNNTENKLSVVNGTNLTPYTGLNFTVVSLGQSTIKNISFTSSCNSTVQTVGYNTTYNGTAQNGTFIYPFNYSSGTCKDRVSGTRTLTITAFDFVGNSQTQLFSFSVDDLGPSLSVDSITERGNNSNNVTLTLSAKDDQAIASFGYYLDRKRDVGTFTSLNLSSASALWLGATAANSTNTFRLNFTPGAHKIKFTANDTLGNVINSSVMTFSVDGLIELGLLGFNKSNLTNSLLSRYSQDNALNVSVVNITSAAGDNFNVTLNVSRNILNMLMVLSNSTKGINLTITFNASAAIWDQYNFSVQSNDSLTQGHITNNWTTSILDYILVNETIQNFLPDNESYFVSVTYPVNASSTDIGGTFEIWYFDDVKDFSNSSSRTNVTQCAAGFSPSLTFTSSSSCWNNTDNKTISVFLPHFSVLAFTNNTNGTPTVNATTPGGNTSNNRVANQTVSSFTPNLTVSADATACSYSINGTGGNKSMTNSGNICLGSTESFKNLAGADSQYSLVFWVSDDDSNTNKYNWTFNMSDTTAPDNGAITSSPSTTTATVTITGTNETVNATVNYGTTNTSLSSSAIETDFNQTQAVSITGLTAGTTYYYNVTVCDFNGNCKTNISTFSFATSAAAAAAAAAASSSSGGGGGGVAPPSNVAGSTGTQWDSLEAGSSGTVKVSNDKIAITAIVIDVKNTVASASVNVQSLVSNPLSTNAAAKVYQYLQITRSNIADSDASKITISFKVPKSWLTGNNIGENDVVLYRYTDSKWNGLPTSMTGSDANNVFYSATTPGFSTFAVGNKEAAPAVTPPAETPTAPPTAEAPKEEAPTTGQPPTAATSGKKGLGSTALAWIVVLIIVVVAGIGYFVWQKKKGE